MKVIEYYTVILMATSKIGGVFDENKTWEICSISLIRWEIFIMGFLWC